MHPPAGGCGPGSGRLSQQEQHDLKRRRESLPRLQQPQQVLPLLEHVNGELLPRLQRAAAAGV